MVQLNTGQSFDQYTVVNEETVNDGNNQSGKYKRISDFNDRFHKSEITYFDETGNEIGTSSKHFIKSQQGKVPILIKREQGSTFQFQKRHITPVTSQSSGQQVKFVNADGQVIQLQQAPTVVSTSQTAQGAKNQQVMLVSPSFQTFLVPQQNSNQTIQGQFFNWKISIASINCAFLYVTFILCQFKIPIYAAYAFKHLPRTTAATSRLSFWRQIRQTVRSKSQTQANLEIQSRL